MLEGKTYCPVLHTRVAEMQALEMLPAASKEAIFPLIVARPWPNANQLTNTWNRIQSAFGDRRFALDLDPFKRGAVRDKPAGIAFDALFDPANGHSAYYDQVRALDHAVPVVQFHNGVVADLDQQAAHIIDINRGAVLRLEHGLSLQPLQTLENVIQVLDDLALWIDLGWRSRDLLTIQPWASALLDVIGRGSPESEVVVSGSSFPVSFSPVERDVVRARERELYDDLVRRHNAVQIKYGDWGSTRAPRAPTPMRVVKRIDLPTPRDWVCFRDAGDETYQGIAERTVNDPSWPEGINIWGTYLIQGTAEAVPGSIRGQAAAAAARINIHLYRQAHYGGDAAFGDADEPFTDDF